MTDVRVWRRGAIALLSVTAVWLVASWAALHGWLTVTYEIDVPATLMLAITSLVILGLSLGTWRGLRHGSLLVPEH